MSTALIYPGSQLGPALLPDGDERIRFFTANGWQIVPAWQANAGYAAGAATVSPAGQVVKARSALSGSATYNDADWTSYIDPPAQPPGSTSSTSALLIEA